MMAKISLVPGYRFRPSDADLVCHYLKRKVAGQPIQVDVISEIDLYKFAPWDLPDKSRLQSKDLEWYFFCPQERKYPNGSRRSRTTDIGFWKSTGKDKPVIYKSRTVGMKKTLVFHSGKGPQGKRTDWAMYEYRLEEKELDAYVVCKIFKKSGLGPKISEPYSAPFNEENQENGAIVDNAFSLPSASSPNPSDDHPVLLDLDNQQSAAPGVCEVSSTPDLLDEMLFDESLLDQFPEFLNSFLLDSESANNKDAYGVCKIFKKSGPSPKIGNPYSAPFNEENQENGAIVDNAFSLPSTSSPNPSDDHPVLLDPDHQQSAAPGVCEVSSTPDLLDEMLFDESLLDQFLEFLNSFLLDSESANNMDAYDVCNIFKKSGPSPKNGDPYSAPFNEENQENGAIVDNAFSLPSASSPNPSDDHPVLLDLDNQQSAAPGVCEVSSTPDLLDEMLFDESLLDQFPEFLNSFLLDSESANNKMEDGRFWKNSAQDGCS